MPALLNNQFHLRVEPAHKAYKDCIRSKKQLASWQLPSILLTPTKLRVCAVQNVSCVTLNWLKANKLLNYFPFFVHKSKNEVRSVSTWQIGSGVHNHRKLLCPLYLYFMDQLLTYSGWKIGCATPTLVFIWVKQGKDQTELWLPEGQESYHYVVIQRVHHCHRKAIFFNKLLQHLPPVLLFTLQLLY